MSTSSTLVEARALNVAVTNSADASISYGGYFSARNGGTSVDVYGIYSEAIATGDPNNVYGIYSNGGSNGIGIYGTGNTGVQGVSNSPTGNALNGTQSNATGYALYATGGRNYFSGNLGIGTTSPYAKLSVVGQIVGAYFTATTTATSTFGGSLAVTEANATSTFAGGIDLSDGCFALDGVCIGAGSGVTSIDVSGGTTGLTTTGGPVTTSGTITLAGTLNVANGGTGWAAIQAGTLLYGNGASALATTSAGTAGQVLALLGGVPTWTATTTFGSGLSYAAGIASLNTANANSWTALQQFTNSSSTLASVYNALYVGTTATTTISGTATSTFGAGIQTAYLNITGVAATSTFANGITLGGGCFSINGVCIGSGSGAGTVNSGTIGQVAFYAANGTAVSGTSTLILIDEKVGIGTSSPWATFAVNPVAGLAANQFVVGSSSATAFVINNSGKVGIGSTTPTFALSVSGTGEFSDILLVDGKVRAGTSTGVSTLPHYSFNADLDTGMYLIAANTIGFSANGGEVFRMSNATINPNVDMHSNNTRSYYLENSAGTVSAPNYAFATDQDTGMWSQYDNAFNFSVGGTELIRADIASTSILHGNVGIGTTSPYAKLSVVGQVVGEYFTATSTTATSTFNGGLVVDAGTLVADYSTNRVGIGTLTPMQALSVSSGGLQVAGLISGSAGTGVLVGYGNTANTGRIQSITIGSAFRDLEIQTRDVIFSTGVGAATEAMRLLNTGNLGVGTSSPYAKLSVVGEIVGAYFTATTTATSTFGGSLAVTEANATSTFAGGIDLSDGCFALDGVCIGAGSGAGTVNSGTLGQVAFYAANGTAVSGTSTLILLDEKVGIGTSSPWATLAVNPVAGLAANQFVIGSSTATAFIVNNSGNVGVGTSSIKSKLAIQRTDGSHVEVFPNSGDLLEIYQAADEIRALHIDSDGNTTIANSVGNMFTSSGSSVSLAAVNGIARFFIDTTSNVGIGTTSPYAKLSVVGEIVGAYFTATTTATSTFGGSLAVTEANATSTFAGGIDLSDGCFALDGVCIGAGAGSGTVNTGTAGYFAYYPASNTTVDDQTVLNISGSNIGIGTSSPYATLSVVGQVVASHFNATSTTATSTIANALIIGNSNNLNADTIPLRINSNQTSLEWWTEFSGTSDDQIKIGRDAATGHAKIQAFRDNSVHSLLLNPAGGRVGVATTSPFARFAINPLAGDLFAFAIGSSTKSLLAVSTEGFGTTTLAGLNISGQATSTSNVGFNISAGCFAINGTCISGGGAGSGTVNSGTLGQVAFYAANGTAVSGTSTLILLDEKVGIGTSSPYAKLSVVGEVVARNFTATSTTATTTLAGGLHVNSGALVTNFSTGVTTISTLEAGNFNFEDNAGINSWADLTVTSSAPVDTPQGYIAFLDGNPMFSIYGESNGTGVVKKTAVGIGTSTPFALLSVQNNAFAASSTYSVFIASSTAAFATTTHFAITNTGNVGFGTSSPWATLAVNPSAGFSSNQFVIGSSTATSFLVTNRGFVGVGTTSPSARFAINPLAGDLFAFAIGSSTKSLLSVSTEGFGTTTLAGLDISGQATSTSNVGFNISAGCFAINGTCISGGGAGSGTVNSGTLGQVAFYAANGTAVSGTSTLILLDEKVGIGTSSPYAKLSVVGEVVARNFTATSTTATSTFAATTTVTNLLANKFVDTNQSRWLSLAELGGNRGFGRFTQYNPTVATTSFHAPTNYYLATSTLNLSSSRSTNDSGATYNPVNNSILMINNSNLIYEHDLDGKLLRTITLVGFADTESLVWMYDDMFAIGEESAGMGINFGLRIPNGTTTINRNLATRIDLTGTFGTSNQGVEGLAYDLDRDVFYIGIEGTGDTMSVYTVTRSGAVSVTFSTSTWAAADIGDISDLYYDRNTGHMFAGVDQCNGEANGPASTLCDGMIEIDMTTGAIIDKIHAPAGFSQVEGIGFTPDGRLMFMTSEGDMFAKYIAQDRGTPFSFVQFASSTPVNLSVLTNIGVGTSTPEYGITIATSTKSQLALSAGAGIAQWAFRNAGGNLYLSTTTVLGTATTSISALEIAGDGFGTTTLRGLSILGQATSTSNVGFNITSGCYAVNGTCVGGGGVGGGYSTVQDEGSGLAARSILNFLGTGVSCVDDGVDSTDCTITAGAGSMAIGSSVTSGTSGSVLFVDSGGLLAQDNSHFFWDETNNRLGLGTTSPYAKLSVVGEVVASHFTATSTTATSTFAATTTVRNIVFNGKLVDTNQSRWLSLAELGGNRGFGRFTQYNPTVATTTFHPPTNYYLATSTLNLSSVTASNNSGVTYNPVNNSLFFINNSNFIYEHDLDGKHIRTITLANFTDTEALAWMYDDMFVIGDEQGGRITYLRLPNGTTTVNRNVGTTISTSATFGVGNSTIEGVTYDLDRDVFYIGIEGSGTGAGVYTVTRSGTITATFSTSTWQTANIGDVSDLYYDRNTGHMFASVDQCYGESNGVASTLCDGFIEIDMTTGAIIDKISAPSGFFQVEGIGFTPDGRLMFLDGENDMFAKYIAQDRGTPFSFVQFASSTPVNLSVLTNIGVGTSTPEYGITIATSTKSQLALSAGAGIAQWAFRNAGGNLYLSTTTVLGTATTSISALEIAGDGFGTTTLRGLSILGQATSTSNVGFNITSGCYAVNGTCVGGGGVGGGYSTVQDEGSGLAARSILNFLGTGVSCIDDGVDSTDCTINTSAASLSIGSAITGGTPGSVLFVDAGGLMAQDNAAFFWDYTNDRLGLGSSTPYAALSVVANGTAPKFVVATSTTGDNQPLLFVNGTTTGALDWARVAIGTTTTWGAESGLRDQFTVAGRIYSTWREMRCDFPGASLTAQITATTPNFCGGFAYQPDTSGRMESPVTVQGNANYSHNPHVLRLISGGTTDASASGAGAAIRSITTFFAASSSPTFEVVSRLGTSTQASFWTMASSSIYMIGFHNITAGTGGDVSVIPTNAIMFVATTTTNWIALVRNNSTYTSYVNTGVPTTTSPNIAFNRFRIEANQNDVTFVINGKVVSKLVSNGSNIPSTNLGYIISAGSTAAGRGKTMEISQIRLWVDDPTGGGISEGLLAAASDMSVKKEEDEVTFEDVLGGYNSSAESANSIEYMARDARMLGEGTLVSLSTTTGEVVQRAQGTYDPSLFGVVNISSVQTLGHINEHTVKVATAGRTYVRVNTENGPIVPGDYLTSSSVDGVAMKATGAGQVIGRAIEKFDKVGEEGLIVTTVEPSYYVGNTFALNSLGNMTAQSFASLTSKSFVKDVEYLTASSTETLVGGLVSIKVSYYRDVSAASTSPLQLGLITEDVPSEIRTADGKQVDLLKLSALIVAGLQEQKKKLDGLHIDTVNNELVLSKALRVTSMATFGGGLTVDSISSIGTSLTFNNDTVFFGRPYFNTDTAGFAVIGEGARDVEVVFDSEYLEQPIVNASIALDDIGDEDQVAAVSEALFDQDIRFLITKKSVKGFTIILNKPAPRDVQFSWIALAVKGARTATSSQVQNLPVEEDEQDPQVPEIEIVPDPDTQPIDDTPPPSEEATTTISNGEDDLVTPPVAEEESTQGDQTGSSQTEEEVPQPEPVIETEDAPEPEVQQTPETSQDSSAEDTPVASDDTGDSDENEPTNP